MELFVFYCESLGQRLAEKVHNAQSAAVGFHIWCCRAVHSMLVS